MNTGKSIFDLPLRVTFYARVSTGSNEQANSLKNQIDFYSDFIKQNPLWTYVNGYIDEALSGTSVSKRESFLKMIDDGKLGKFDFIITKEISRFSRNTLDSIKYTQELLTAGVGVLFQSDNINTLMPDSELRLTIMASLAQDEVRRLSERVKFGHKRSVAKGIVYGNNRITGYTKQNGKLIINEKEAEMVRKIFHMYATENIGIRAIATELYNQGYRNENDGDVNFITIRRILVNPKYKGYYCGNKSFKYDYKSARQTKLDESEWVIYKDEDNIPPIVSEELWDKANAILKMRSENMKGNGKTSYQNRYLYSGKIYCSEHNIPYYRTLYRYPSGNKEVWHCREYKQKGKAACESPSIYTTELNEIIKDAYNLIVKDKSKIVSDLMEIYSSISNDSKIKEDIAKIKTEIADIAKRKDKLLDLNINGHISDDEFSRRNRKFNLDVEGLEVRLISLEEEEEKNISINSQIAALEKLIDNNLDYKSGLDNSVVDSLVDRIVVTKTDDKKVIDLDVYFKVLGNDVRYRIDRNQSTSFTANEKGNDDTSVCLPSAL